MTLKILHGLIFANRWFWMFSRYKF